MFACECVYMDMHQWSVCVNLWMCEYASIMFVSICGINMPRQSVCVWICGCANMHQQKTILFYLLTTLSKKKYEKHNLFGNFEDI